MTIFKKQNARFHIHLNDFKKYLSWVNYQKHLSEDQAGRIKNNFFLILLTKFYEVCRLEHQDEYTCVAVINVIFPTNGLLSTVDQILWGKMTINLKEDS